VSGVGIGIGIAIAIVLLFLVPPAIFCHYRKSFISNRLRSRILRAASATPQPGLFSALSVRAALIQWNVDSQQL
jgi:hypothetical protein